MYTWSGTPCLHYDLGKMTPYYILTLVHGIIEIVSGTPIWRQLVDQVLRNCRIIGIVGGPSAVTGYCSGVSWLSMPGFIVR